MKNYDAHAALVAAVKEARARRVADARMLAATVRGRRANARRELEARTYAVALVSVALAVLAVAVIL